MVIKKENISDQLEISLWLVDDETEMAEINKKYRGVNDSTDVLSFPQYDKEELNDLIEELSEGNTKNMENIPLGDIIISLIKVEEQAREYNHSVEREMGFLYLHGLLHLLGYDHGDESSEEEMLQKQEKILAEIGLKR